MNSDDKTILFITCVSNEDLYQLCLKYIQKLRIPPSFNIEFLSLKNVNSMASGYNQALQHKAKYKIYLHQDTFITEENFLIYLVNLFDRYKEVGLIGLTGCKKIPSTGVWWEGEDLVGKVIDCRFKEPYLLDFDKNINISIDDLEIVQAIDGFLMATQYDVKWKEEWFDGFHFYDTSQSLEFKKNGYLIGIPFQQTAWSKHGENFKGDYQLDYMEYERNRQIFVNKYKQDLYIKNTYKGEMKMNSIQYNDLYLELLKKTILFEIWYEYESYFPFPTTEENSADVQYVKQIQAVTTDVNRRKYGLDWPILAHSMIGRTRLNQLHLAMQTVLDEKVEGDFIETGVWRGGACIFMRGFLKNYNILDRKVWVADSFEGLPIPNAEEYPVDENDILYKFKYLSVSLENVKRNFEKFDLLDEQVMFLKGWFKDTLPVAPINKVAIARLDGDMYESTMDSLTNLYDKVSPGGFIIIDDYSLHTCKMAVTDFRRDRNIKDPLQPIDQCSVFWRKGK